MTATEAKDKRRLEEENATLKKVVAQLAMEIDTLKVGLGTRSGARARSQVCSARRVAMRRRRPMT
jgi:hypothetical protein